MEFLLKNWMDEWMGRWMNGLIDWEATFPWDSLKVGLD
jgi:hypothetical protein